LDGFPSKSPRRPVTMPAQKGRLHGIKPDMKCTHQGIIV
jgi:hypothetical protein